MKENNELLLQIYENVDMGLKSTKHLIKLIHDKDNKIKSLLEVELHEFEKFFKECKKHLKNNKVKCNKTNIMSSLMANNAMCKEIDKDNSDSKIAGMLIQGFIMGTTELDKKITDFEKETSKDVLRFAKSYLEFQQNQVKKLKEYL